MVRKTAKKKKKSSRTFFDSYVSLFRLNSEQEETVGKIQNKFLEESFNLIDEITEESEESPEKQLSLENESLAELDTSIQHDESESNEVSGDENTKQDSKYNFLKLNNTGASCYSNCIVQAILSLGPNIFNTVRFFVFKFDSRFYLEVFSFKIRSSMIKQKQLKNSKGFF